MIAVAAYLAEKLPFKESTVYRALAYMKRQEKRRLVQPDEREMLDRILDDGSAPARISVPPLHPDAQTPTPQPTPQSREPSQPQQYDDKAAGSTAKVRRADLLE